MRELTALYKGEAGSLTEYEDDESLGRYRGWCGKHANEILVERLHESTIRLWRLYELKRGKYPFRANDLAPDDWRMLGRMDLMFARIDMERLAITLFGEPK